MAWYGDNYNIVMGVVVGLKPILPSAQIEGERTRLEKTDQFAIKRLRIQTNLSSRKLLAKNPGDVQNFVSVLTLRLKSKLSHKNRKIFDSINNQA